MNKSKFSLDDDNTETIDKAAIKKFARGALDHSIGNSKIEKDWREEDPNGPPSYNFRLRLNKYQIGMLKDIANLEKRSISNLIKIILMDSLNNKNIESK